MTSSSARLDRAMDWLLDRDGDIYGDERERLRWYEGITATASVQWILVPWVVAVGVWVGGRPVAPVLLAVALALYVPMVLTAAYVQRRNVRTAPASWSRKRVIVSVLTMLPYLVAAVGFGWAFLDPPDPDVARSALIGAAIGGPAGLAVALVVQLRRKRHAARIETDEDAVLDAR